MKKLKRILALPIMCISMACGLGSCDQIGSWKNASIIEITWIDNEYYGDIPLGISLGVYILLQYRIDNSTTISVKTARNEYIETITTYKGVKWRIEESNK